MPGTITVREALRRWSVLLQDIDPQFTRHPESEGVDWLNDAQRALYTYLPVACSRVDTIRLKAGTVQSIENILAVDCKPGDGSTPTAPVIGSMLLDVMNNMGVDGLTLGKAVRPLLDGREVLDTLNPNWHAESDVALLNFIYDPRFPRQFLAYPGVPTARLWARMAYIASPLLVPNVGDAGYATYASSGSNPLAISVHDEHVPDLVNYMAARALMKNAQFAAATGMSAGGFVTLFTDSINAKSMALMQVNPNLKALPFMPAPIGAAS